MSWDSEHHFPDRWRDQLTAFAEEASSELIIDRRVMAFEEVITRLSEQVTNRVNVVCEFGEQKVTLDENGGISNIRTAINATSEDIFLLVTVLRKIWDDPHHPDWHRMKNLYLWNDSFILRLSSFLFAEYGEDAKTLASLVCAWAELDVSDKLGYRIDLPSIPEYSRAKMDREMIDVMWMYSPPEGKYTEEDTFSIGHFSSFTFRNRILKHKTFQEAVNVLLRLLATKKSVRAEALLLLQNFRHKPHDSLIQVIVKLGYDTLLEMEAMTEYDLWEKLERGQLRQASLALISCVDQKNIDAANAVALKEGDPETLRYLQNDDEREVWRKANAYLSSHEPEPRMRIRDKLPCEKYRAELKSLRETYQWDALGAKEREIINHVFSEVVCIEYAYAENEDRPHDEISFKTGVPVYAVENQRLNCFTGPWLIAALCLECGIPYHRLFYCNVNENFDGAHAGSHGSLFMHYSDGSMGFIDYSYKRSNRSFLLKHVKRPLDQKRLIQLLGDAEGWGKQNMKIPGDPVHLYVDHDVAKLNHLYTDMHILPLDVGFGAIQMLHTGLSFRDQGRMEEALEAFELGLTMFPTSPDLLCQCAIIHYEKADIDRAEWLIDLALSEYPNHLLSKFQKAKILHVRGKIDDATVLFNKIGFDQREMWGDTSVKAQANRYCVNNQLKMMPDIVQAVMDAEHAKRASGESILTRCEDYLL